MHTHTDIHIYTHINTYAYTKLYNKHFNDFYFRLHQAQNYYGLEKKFNLKIFLKSHKVCSNCIAAYSTFYQIYSKVISNIFSKLNIKLFLKHNR